LKARRSAWGRALATPTTARVIAATSRSSPSRTRRSTIAPTRSTPDHSASSSIPTAARPATCPFRRAHRAAFRESGPGEDPVNRAPKPGSAFRRPRFLAVAFPHDAVWIDYRRQASVDSPRRGERRFARRWPRVFAVKSAVLSHQTPCAEAARRGTRHRCASIPPALTTLCKARPGLPRRTAPAADVRIRLATMRWAATRRHRRASFPESRP